MKWVLQLCSQKTDRSMVDPVTIGEILMRDELAGVEVEVTQSGPKSSDAGFLS